MMIMKLVKSQVIDNDLTFKFSGLQGWLSISREVNPKAVELRPIISKTRIDPLLQQNIVECIIQIARKSKHKRKLQ
jgi:hypothetical protein